MPGFDKSAKGDRRQRRMFQKQSAGEGGFVFGNGIDFDPDTDTISVFTDPNGGLQSTITGLGIKLDATPGLVLGSGGIKVLLDPSTPFLQETTGLKVLTGSSGSTVCIGNDVRLSDARTPLPHAPSHKSGGTDPIKLDELAAPTDITTLNVSTTAHGLTPKLPNDATKYLDGTGAYTVPPGGGGGTGTVTTVSVATANGFSGTVANATTTPAITIIAGAITPTSVNGLTITTSTGTLTIASGKTLTMSNTLTFTGTDGSTVAAGAGGTVAYVGTIQTWSAAQTFLDGNFLLRNSGNTASATLKTNASTARTYTFPNRTGTIATLEGSQAFTAGTITMSSAFTVGGVSTFNNDVTFTAGTFFNGGAVSMQALEIDPASDIVQLLINGNVTQTADIVVVKDASANPLWAIDPSGNMRVDKVGSGIRVKKGTNAKFNQGQVLSGGTLTINNTSVTANSTVLLVVTSVGVLANFGPIYEDKASRVAGTSFTIKSSNVLSNATFDYFIVEPS